MDLVGDLPAAFRRDAVDLRPMKTAMTAASEASDASAIVVAGPEDLAELRDVVERVTGPGTWPFRHQPQPGWTLAETHTESVPIERPAQLMGFVVAIDELLPDRSAAWRTRKTLREAIGVSLKGVDSVTVSAWRIEPV